MSEEKQTGLLLEELVRRVAYMFYNQAEIMVLVGLLEMGKPVTDLELSQHLKYKKTDLNKVLGTFRADGFITIEKQVDAGDEDPETLTQAKRKKLEKDYYALDFKMLVDSVQLKIYNVRKMLSQQCGKEDLIFYQCPKCQAIFKLTDLITGTDDAELHCLTPDCDSIVVEMDDTAEVNEKKKRFKEFVQMTDPLLDIINKAISGMVMLDDPDLRCKPDRMVAIDEYNKTMKSIQEEKRLKQYMGGRSSSGGTSAGAIKSMGDKLDVIVSVEAKQVSKAELSEDIMELVQKEAPKPQEIPKSKSTIMINGKDYSVDQITQEILDTIPEDDPDEYQRVIDFIESNK